MMRASSQLARFRLGLSAFVCSVVACFDFSGAAGAAGLASSNVTWPSLFSAGLVPTTDGRCT